MPAEGDPSSSSKVERTLLGVVGAGIVGALACLLVFVTGETPQYLELVFGGMPHVELATKSSQYIVLKNSAFIVGYDEYRMCPLWVSYRVFQIDEPYDYARPDRFIIDSRTSSRISYGDYTSTGYTRGLCAPNDAIMTRYGRVAQKETFLMSNVVPQKGLLNSGPWRDLENDVKEYAQAFEEVWVITGPVFGTTPDVLRRVDAHADDRAPKPVQIPDAFYKIIVDVCPDSTIRCLSVILPQAASSTSMRDSHLGFADFICTVDEIEAATRIDFFSELPDSIEIPLEATRSPGMWNVDTACESLL